MKRPDFEYSVECGFYICPHCETPWYPMEVEEEVCPGCGEKLPGKHVGAISLRLLQTLFKGRTCVEETDVTRARELSVSKASACWGGGEMRGTGWTVLMQTSPEFEKGPAFVIVCKTEVLK